MGYWKDNFPGSAAYFQRIRFARGAVVYAVVACGIIYAVSPFSKRIQKWIETGAAEDPLWLQEKLSKKFSGLGIAGLPDREKVNKNFQITDRADHGDWARPRLWEKTKGIIGSKQEISTNSPGDVTPPPPKS